MSVAVVLSAELGEGGGRGGEAADLTCGGDGESGPPCLHAEDFKPITQVNILVSAHTPVSTKNQVQMGSGGTYAGEYPGL